MAGSYRFVLGLAAAGGELSVAAGHWLWQHTARSGRIERHLHRLERSGLLQNTGRLDARVLRLTAEGRLHAAAGVDPETQWNRQWDGAWRLVLFDIPETQRALRLRLRRRLHEFRFGYLQDSVWISPDPVDAFRARVGETGVAPDSLAYLKANPDGGENTEALVAASWDFAALGRRYTDYRAILRLRPSRLTATTKSWIHWLEREHRAWRQIALRDPFLPGALLPKAYVGRTAWKERLAALAEFRQRLPKS